MIIHYNYDERYIDKEPHKTSHEQILGLLNQLKAKAKIADFKVLEHQQAFDAEEEKKAFLEKLADFSLVHHVGLAHIFGSRKHGFCYLPIQFLVVYEDSDIREVFPCKIGEDRVEMTEFLGALDKGEAWTKGVPSKKEGAHEKIVEAIISNPGLVEAGLTFVNRDMQVGHNVSDMGFIDVVFKDFNGTYLLVEVKAKSSEIDEAIGKILRHRKLFASQNSLQDSRIRAGIVSPYMSTSHKKICADIGIDSFEIREEFGSQSSHSRNPRENATISKNTFQ